MPALADLLRRHARETQALPERVRQAIRAQEDQSEILIGWVQLVIVSVMGALYAVAPKTFDPGAGTVEPVPLALGGYFGFTLIRLGLAYRRALPRWLLELSIVIDMALLMGLIWSFHVQYQQPPSFYLKAPTLLYVFIFIALRALRFDPSFVLMSGVVAALGWAGLVAYAALTDPAGNMVTRDYIMYITDNRILIGAEIDKMMAILLVTAVLALALARGRRLLIRAVTEGMAARDLARFFAPEIVTRITRAEQQIRAGQGEARDAAILMVDLRGFTRLATTLAPDAVIALLTEYRARLVPAIHAHGGSIDKFLGDGIMATFGAAAPTASYAADGLRAIDAVLAAVDTWNRERVATGAPPLEVNAALATGRVVFGAVGDRDRLEYTVIGDAVNLTAKLEKHNKTEAVRALTTAEAFAIAEAQGYRPPAPVEHRRACRITGVEQPLDLVVLAPTPLTRRPPLRSRSA